MVRNVGPGGDKELPKIGQAPPIKDSGKPEESSIPVTSKDVVTRVVDKLFPGLSPRAKEILADRSRGFSSDKNPIADA